MLLKEGADYLDADTGDMISPPYDAVIMAEELIETETGYKIIPQNSEGVYPMRMFRLI